MIGETTIIGNRVKMYHGVTLGAFSNKSGRADANKKRHPTLEDEIVQRVLRTAFERIARNPLFRAPRDRWT